MRRLANSDATNAVCSLPRLRGRDGGGGRRTRFIFLHAPSLTLPRLRAGESHVGFCKSLLTKGKWILKVASDSEGAADERIWRVLCRPARPARGECAARFDRDFVHRVAGDAVRSDELH